jgi:hypothetical protein
MSSDFLDPPMCAYITEAVQCPNEADCITCTNLYLVWYYSEHCQGSLAAEHGANTCKHEYVSQSWNPQWFVERRAPKTRSDHAA